MKNKIDILNMGMKTSSATAQSSEPVISTKIIDNAQSSKNSQVTNIIEGIHGAFNDAVFSNATVRDGSFNNPALKLGASDYALNSAEYLADMITFQRASITNIYHGSWIYRRLIDKFAEDMWRGGISIAGDTDPEGLKRIYKRLARLRPELIWVTGQARLYGGAASLIMVDDGVNDLSKPLNLKGIKKGTPIQLWSTDRWFGLSTSLEKVTNYKSRDFNTPKYYTFYIDDVSNGNTSANVVVHHSRVLRFVNRRSTRLINSKLNGWGISELEHIFQDLMIHENAKNSAGSLIQKALLEVFHISGMRGTMQGLSGGNTASRAMLSGQLTGIQSFRQSDMILLDQDTKYEQFTYQFAGLAELLETQRDIIAGAAEMPKVLLYGDTKGGLTSDSPAEMEFYAGTVNGKQENMLRNPLDKLLPIIFACEGVQIPTDLDYEFESIAGTSQEKRTSLLQATLNAVQTAVDLGIMTHKTALKELQQVQKITGFGTNLDADDEKLAEQSDQPENAESDGEETIEELPMPNDDYVDAKDEILGKKKLFDKLRRRKNEHAK